MKKALIACSIILFLVGCKKNTDPAPYNVPADFAPYLQHFLDEGVKRGKTFDLNKDGITIKIAKLSSGIRGTTYPETRTIEMDSIWFKSNDFIRERWLFHELGHLLLNRSHEYRRLTNGEPMSLMWTSENNPDKCADAMFKGIIRQKYYLDELFNQATPTPDYAMQTSIDIPNLLAATLFRQEEASGSQLGTNLKKALNLNTSTFTTTLNNGILSLQIPTQNFKGFQLSMAELFPNLDTTTLKDYELRVRVKNNGNSLTFDWRPNLLRDNAYFFQSAFCSANSFSVFNYWGGYYTSVGATSSTDFDEYIFRNKGGVVNVWLNQKMIFTSDILTTTQPFSWIAYFSLNPGIYDFDYFRLYKL